MPITASEVRSLYQQNPASILDYQEKIKDFSPREVKLFARIIELATNHLSITFHEKYRISRDFIGRDELVWDDLGKLSPEFIAFLELCGFKVRVTHSGLSGGDIYQIDWSEEEAAS